MTTSADNLRAWLERVPATAEVLELHPLGALPTDSPLACWPREQAARDTELVRGAIADTAQQHVDDEGKASSFNLEWKKAGNVIGSRRVHFRPTPGSEATTPAAAPIDGNAMVAVLLKTITDQQRLMIQAVGGIVAAHQSTLQAITEQMRVQNERLLAHDALSSVSPGRGELDPEERKLRVQALGVIVNEGPSIVKLILHAAATKMLGADAAETLGEAVEGATQQ